MNKRRSQASRAVAEQYRVERELGMRLRKASAAERRQLYSQVYDEFFRTFSEGVATRSFQLHLLRPFLRPDSVFPEQEIAASPSQANDAGYRGALNEGRRRSGDLDLSMGRSLSARA